MPPKNTTNPAPLHPDVVPPVCSTMGDLVREAEDEAIQQEREYLLAIKNARLIEVRAIENRLKVLSAKKSSFAP